LKLPEGHKFPIAQELQGRPYCKWHHLFTHTSNDCKVLHRQIQSAIEQGRLILRQFAMKVDTRPFLGVNTVEGHMDASERSATLIGFHVRHQYGRTTATSRREGGGQSPRSAPEGQREYITEEQVKHVQYQWPLSAHPLKKYEYQYWQHR
jgi:hypothetical protein